MRIAVKGRNTTVPDELRERVERSFGAIAKQVSALARLDIVIEEARNPANPARYVAQATLHLKGATLLARDASRDMAHAVNLCAAELSRQVKRDRDKRRRRREVRGTRTAAVVAGAATPPIEPAHAGEISS